MTGHIGSFENLIHQPVLVNEIVGSLNLKNEGIIVDGTIGLGGHSWAILAKSPPGLKIIGIDLDAQAIKIAQDRLKTFKDRITLIQGNFRHLDKILEALNVNKIDGLLLDLGLSSLQLDSEERGFSFFSDQPLDMRFDQSQVTTAAYLVNKLSQDELIYILKELGQERFAIRIAKNIIQIRKKEEIRTTAQLAGAVLKSLPRQRHYQKIHPATRTFQALRIYLNQELEALKEGIEKGIFFLNPQGRAAVISFHSLEDRIVKQSFKKFAQEGIVKIITKKPMTPGEQEILTNRRSRSAKLRIGERIG